MQDSRLRRKKGMKTLYNNDPEKTAHLNKRRVHQASLKNTENC